MTLFSVLMLWDGWVVYFAPENWSVSHYIMERTGFNPFGFYCGIFCGHLWANQAPDVTDLIDAWWDYRRGIPGSEERVSAAIQELKNQGPLRYVRKVFKK